MFEAVEDVRIYIKDGGSSRILNTFFDKFTNAANRHDSIDSTVCSTLGSGSFWIDFFNYSKENNFTNKLLVCKLFTHLIRYKSLLLLGIELLGISNFRTLLNVHFKNMLQLFLTTSSISLIEEQMSSPTPITHEYKERLIILSAEEMLYMLVYIARIIIACHMDHQTTALQKLKDLDFMKILGVFLGCLTVKDTSVFRLILQRHALFRKITDLVDIVVYIGTKDPDIFFEKKSLLISFFFLIGKLAESLMDYKTEPLEIVKAVRLLRTREVEEVRDDEKTLLLSYLYTPSTCHLFDSVLHGPRYVWKEGRDMFYCFMGFIHFLEQKIRTVSQDEKHFVTGLFHQVLQCMIRANILDFWNNDSLSSCSISHEIVGKVLNLKSLLKWVFYVFPFHLFVFFLFLHFFMFSLLPFLFFFSHFDICELTFFFSLVLKQNF